METSGFFVSLFQVFKISFFGRQNNPYIEPYFLLALGVDIEMLLRIMDGTAH
jgi:hypothetical protein